MTNNEAKFILQAYRPNGQDAHDPQFAEALEQARRDPELAEWFLREKQSDAAIAAKLNETSLPPDLKMTLLAANKIVRPSFWQRRRKTLACAAAAALILSGLWFSLPQSKPDFPTFQQTIAGHIEKPTYDLGFRSQDFDQLQTWIAARQGHQTIQLPSSLKNLQGVGCDVFNWRETKVTFICFATSGADKVHLFVIDRSQLPDPPSASASPVFAQADHWNTAAWADKRHVYLLASHKSAAELADLL